MKKLGIFAVVVAVAAAAFVIGWHYRGSQTPAENYDQAFAEPPAAEVEAATWVTKRANMAVRRVQSFGNRTELAVELNLLQIGPSVLAAIPCEPFAQIGLAVKAASPFPFTWFGGYVGGWLGYLPVPEEYPRKGYEVDTTPFRPDAAAVVVDGTVAALKELNPELIVPAHCTGWKAVHAIARELPQAFVQNSVGTRLVL